MTTGFETWTARWVCADLGGVVVANRVERQGWETFTPERQFDGRYAFKTDHGTYLSAWGDGRMLHKHPFDEPGAVPGPDECFELIRHGEDQVSLKTTHGTCVSAMPDLSLVHRYPWDDPTADPGPYETFTVTPWWKAVGGPRPSGLVRLAGRGLADDRGAFLAGTTSWFMAPRQKRQRPDLYARNLETLAAMRSDAPRIITDLGWPGDREQNGPEGIPQLLSVIDDCWEIGSRVQLTVFGSLKGARIVNGRWEDVYPYRLDTQDKRRRYASELCEALRGREDRVLFIEVCNEPENGGVGPMSRDDQADLQRLIKRLLPSLVVTLGAPGGQGATSWNDDDYNWYGRHGEMVLPHLDRGYRDMGWGAIHQGIHSAQFPYPWVDNEPIGPGSSVRSENDPTKLRMGRTFAWMCNAAATCFHSYAGIGLGADSDYPIADEPGVLDCFDARQVLPADLPNWRFHNWHWASNPMETVDGCWPDHPQTNRGTVRTLACTTGNQRVVGILKAAPNGATLRPRESMRLTQWQWESGGYIDLGTKDYPAGVNFELPAGAPEILFIGQAI